MVTAEIGQCFKRTFADGAVRFAEVIETKEDRTLAIVRLDDGTITEIHAFLLNAVWQRASSSEARRLAN